MTAAAAAASAGAVTLTAEAATGSPGAAGLGDRLFPVLGNGGYDAASYDVSFDYRPETTKMAGTVAMSATATHALSRFNLDSVGQAVESVTVDGGPANFRTEKEELVITPADAVARGRRFTVVVRFTADRAQEPRSAAFPEFPGVDFQVHNGSTMTVVSRCSASRTGRISSFPATTTRRTRRPSPSESRCRLENQTLSTFSTDALALPVEQQTPSSGTSWSTSISATRSRETREASTATTRTCVRRSGRRRDQAGAIGATRHERHRALMLYALRQEIGKAQFRKVEGAFLDRFRDRAASTQDYIDTVNQVTGRDQTAFLRARLFGDTTPPMPGHPEWKTSTS